MSQIHPMFLFTVICNVHNHTSVQLYKELHGGTYMAGIGEFTVNVQGHGLTIIKD